MARAIAAVFLLHEGFEVGHRLLHGAGALHHLGQEHLARSKQISHDVHAVHQRAFDDEQGPAELLTGLLVHPRR